jgi:hypothetical protein
MSALDLSPAAAVDVVTSATETAFRTLENRVAYLEAALVDAQRANARAIAGLLRDLEAEGKPVPAPASGGKPPVEAAADTVVEEIADPVKSAEASDKSDRDKSDKSAPARRKHRFL